jgi:hypothetical protein
VALLVLSTVIVSLVVALVVVLNPRLLGVPTACMDRDLLVLTHVVEIRNSLLTGTEVVSLMTAVTVLTLVLTGATLAARATVETRELPLPLTQVMAETTALTATAELYLSE